MAIRHLAPVQAYALLAHGASFVDVRDAIERAAAQADGARGIDAAALERDAARHLPDRDATVVLICQTGRRSAALAQTLQAQGYRDLVSVEGGTQAWRRAQLPMIAPATDDPGAAALARYARQLPLPQVGLDGQRRLQQACVLVVGAGGLGAPVALYLAAAGVGRLRLVDDDRVELSNLHRQILHGDADVGRAKVDSARQRLLALNSTLAIEALPVRLDAGNAEALLQDADVVVDAADNFATRYALNDACIRLRKPLVYGAVQQFDGQVSVFDAGRQRGRAPCYRCLFPHPAPAALAPDCAQAGVLGVLPGIVGMLQATEVLKLLLGIGEPLIGRLLSIDALAMRFQDLRLPPDPHCTGCGAS